MKKKTPLHYAFENGHLPTNAFGYRPTCLKKST